MDNKKAGDRSKETGGEIKPLATNLKPILCSVELLTWQQARDELKRIEQQFMVIHDLPKVGDQKVVDYMWETLELLRQRCIALHWHCISLQIAKRT